MLGESCANCYGHARIITELDYDGVKIRRCQDPRSEYDNSRDDDYCRLWLRKETATKLVGFLYSCSTPECGGVSGYFCVKCRHYCSKCACGSNTGGCACAGTDYQKYWASTGERKMMREKLARVNDG